MHVPLSTALMGEAAGEADFEVRVVPEHSTERGRRTVADISAGVAKGDEAPDIDGDVGGQVAEAVSRNDETGQLDGSALRDEAAGSSAGADGGECDSPLAALSGTPHAPPSSTNMDRLRWDRKHNEQPGQVGEGVLEKRAWVIVPGMGHIGYVPLLSAVIRLSTGLL